MSLNIKFKQLDPNAKIPTRATDGSGAYDLYCIEYINLDSNTRKLTKLGFAASIPRGYVGLVCPRSGTALKDGVTVRNGPGVIDSDFILEWGVILYNSDPIHTKFYEPGDRVAQVLFVKAEDASFEVVDQLEETTRKGGYGHTGR